MTKYLWDLNLEEIPLGWEKDYQDALRNFPAGKIIEVPEIYMDDFEIRESWCNPVAFRTLVLQSFNALKDKALYLLENVNKANFQDTSSKLIRIEFALRTLLFSWVDDDTLLTDYDFSRVRREIDMDCNFGDYFSEEILDFLKPYENYRYFKDYRVKEVSKD